MTWKTLKSTDDLRDLLTAYQPVAIITTAFQMGVFAALNSEGPLTANQLSENCEAHPRSFAMLLNACTGIGLLSFDPSSGKYDLTELSRSSLVPSSPAYLGNFIRLQEDVFNRWQKLSEAVTYNQRVNLEMRGREDGSQKDWNRQFVYGLYDSARLNAGSLADVLVSILKNKKVTNLLDLGCGSGAYSMELASRLPDLTATLYDLPGVLQVTKELIERTEYNKIASQLKLLPGDFHEEEIAPAASYEAVLLSGVIHSETPEGQQELLQKIAATLRPEGLLIVYGPLLNRTKTSPVPDTFAALQTLLSTDQGNVLSLDELQALLKKNGYQSVRSYRLRKNSRRLVTATK